MPIYTVEYGGKKYKLDAPANAKESDLIAAIEGGKKPAPAPVKPADPTEGMSFGEKMLAGAGKAVYDVGNTFGLVDDLGDTRASDEALLNTGAGLAGNIGAEIAATALPGAGAYKAVSAASKVLPKVAQATSRVVGGGAAAGAAGAGTMGADPTEGAVLGAVMGPVGSAIGKGAKMVGEGFDSLTRAPRDQAAKYLRETFGGRTDAVIDTLRNLTPYVPGERVTAGRAAVAGDTLMPELKVLEQGARSRTLGGEFENIDKANELARANVLEKIAEPGKRYRDPVTGENQLSTAEALRKRVTDPLYEKANPDVIPITPDIQDIVKAGPPPAPVAPANPFAGVGVEAPTPFMPQYAGRTISELQQIKNELSTKIRALDTATDGQSKLTRDELIKQRQALDNAMRQGSGTYGVASDIYRNYSVPQNQADVASELLSALRTPTGVERKQAFANAIENAPRTIQRAGGGGQYQNLQEIMSPEQMSSIDALRGSIGREADYAALGAQRGNVPEFLSPADILEQGTPGWFSRTMTLVRSQLKRMGNATDEDVTAIIDDAMTDPNKLADLIETIPQAQRGEQLTASMAKLRKYVPAGAPIGATTGTGTGER